jgi:hypothetical protein
MTVDELRLQGLVAEWPLDAPHGAGGTRPPVPGDPAHAWALGPLANMAGELRVHVTDAAWVLDAEVRLPIQAGGIDFNHATVSHVGPDSSMGLSRMGVYVDAPNGRQYLAMLDGTPREGMRFEHRGALLGSLVTDRGALLLAPLLQSLLAGARPFTPAAGAQALLRRTRIEGQLRLGDGPLGQPGLGLVLTGATVGRNQLTLASTAGGGLLLRWPELSAARLQWPLPGVGAASAESLAGNLSLEVRAGPAGRLHAALKAHELLLRGVRVEPARAASEARDGQAPPAVLKAAA